MMTLIALAMVQASPIYLSCTLPDNPSNIWNITLFENDGRVDWTHSQGEGTTTAQFFPYSVSWRTTGGLIETTFRVDRRTLEFSRFMVERGNIDGARLVEGSCRIQEIDSRQF